MRVKVPLYLPSIALPLYKSPFYPLSPGFFAFAGISLMSGGDFSSLCPVFRKDDRAFFLRVPRIAETLILVGETLPWYHSDLLGLPILGGHPWYHNSPIQPPVAMTLGLFFFAPFQPESKPY